MIPKVNISEFSKLDKLGFNATITAAAKPGLWRSGLQLLSEMKRLRTSPSVVTVNSILSAGHGGKEWGAVLWLLSTMPARPEYRVQGLGLILAVEFLLCLWQYIIGCR